MAYKVTATVQDADAESSRFSFWLSGTLPIADAIADAKSIIEAADNIIDGVITSVGIVLIPDTSTWTLKQAVLGGSDKNEGGRFIWDAAGFSTIVTLPTFMQDTLVPVGSENIDITNLDVGAFITAFVASDTVTEQGTTVTGLQKAYEVHGGKK